MAGNVTTLRRRVPVDPAAREIRTRVARDGWACVLAVTTDPRQVRQLRAVAGVLAEDAGLVITMGERTDGSTVLTAAATGVRPTGGAWGDSSDPRVRRTGSTGTVLARDEEAPAETGADLH
jgi:hypothetical protein